MQIVYFYSKLPIAVNNKMKLFLGLTPNLRLLMCRVTFPNQPYCQLIDFITGDPYESYCGSEGKNPRR